MNARRRTAEVVVALLLVAVVAMQFRTVYRQKRQALPGDSFWQLTYSVQFTAKKAGAKVRAAFPSDTPHGRVTYQKSPDGGPLVERFRTLKSVTREVLVEAKKPGPEKLSASFSIHLSPRSNWHAKALAAPTDSEQRAAYLRSEKLIQADDPLVVETLERFRGQPASKIELLERLFEYCVAEIGSGGREAPADAVTVLKQGVASPAGRARAMVALCRAAKLPARLVSGFQIKQGADVRPQIWVEVLTNGHWEPYDPENGFGRELPHNFLPVRREGAAIVNSNDVADLRSTFAVVRTPVPPDYRTEAQLADVFDLTRLPLEIQQAFRVILLLPLGALLTAFFRTMIGIRTFGTFTPSLLALAFVYNDWRTGMVIFAVVLLLGLVSRTLLDHLKLLLVPRLSVILTLVVLAMVLCVSALDYWQRTPSGQAVLLPLVILTMTVERMYLTSEEDSPQFAVQLLAGTLAVAAGCYLVLRWKTVGQFFLTYPEAHLGTIAVLVLMGRYAGYRLSELWRFRDLANSPS